jgi:polyphosphate kinase 2
LAKEFAFDLDDPKLPKSIKGAAMRSGGYPYDEKLEEEAYDEQLDRLYLQQALMQEHIAKQGTRIVVVFEGRDAAGKGGTIRTYLRNVNPRYNMHVALGKPSDRELTQWYFQRYVDWMPAGRETVLFDRSWYNRAGVEPVMGFSTPAQTAKFLAETPAFERMLVNDGIHLVKFWLKIGRQMQMKRFHDRRHDPLKRWKLSPVDLAALEKYDDYTAARDRMFEATHTADAPWTVVLSNDKRRARLAVLQSVLSRIDYDAKDPAQIGEIDANIVFDAATFLTRKFPE